MQVIPNLIIKRTISCLPGRIFKAWTVEEELKQWFFPAAGYSIPFVEFNLRKNALYRIAMKAPNGDLHLFGGMIKELIVAEKLCFTWASNGGGTQQLKSFITVEFIPGNGTTEVRLTHENFSGETMREGYDKGWNHIFDQLEKHLNT